MIYILTINFVIDALVKEKNISCCLRPQKLRGCMSGNRILMRHFESGISKFTGCKENQFYIRITNLFT